METDLPPRQLSGAYLGLNRFEEAKAILEKAVGQNLDEMVIHVDLFQVAFVQGDSAAMQRQTDWAKGKPQEHSMLAAAANAAAFSGKLSKAKEMYLQASEVAQQIKLREIAIALGAAEALIEAWFGNFREARARAAEAAGIAKGRVGSFAAMSLAVSGDSARAQKVLEGLSRQFATDTLVNSVLLPTVRAAIEIDRGDPARAIALLKAVAPYELGGSGGSGFLPTYTRGLAYLRSRQGSDAAAEFQKILDHRGVDPVSPLYALAYVGLARASALAGDMAKSRRAYQDFLALWKDADPDIPVLQEAKREYAKIRD